MKNIPTHDPYTGELNPYYEELTGEKNPLSKDVEDESLPIGCIYASGVLGTDTRSQHNSSKSVPPLPYTSISSLWPLYS